MRSLGRIPAPALKILRRRRITCEQRARVLELVAQIAVLVGRCSRWDDA